MAPYKLTIYRLIALYGGWFARKLVIKLKNPHFGFVRVVPAPVGYARTSTCKLRKRASFFVVSRVGTPG